MTVPGKRHEDVGDGEQHYRPHGAIHSFLRLIFQMRGAHETQKLIQMLFPWFTFTISFRQPALENFFCHRKIRFPSLWSA
jgi:hypothetical protein